MRRGLKLRFLGTGAANSTPGKGKSHRLESSLFILSGKIRILIDITQFFSKQSAKIDHIDCVLLTHGHLDACGGINQLYSWWKSKKIPPIPIYAHKKTIAAIKEHFQQTGHCEFIEINEGIDFLIDHLTISALEVPHSADPRFATFAWKIKGTKEIVYVSDIANLTNELEKFSDGADFLIIDGSTWKRKIFTHLRIDKDLPRICKWNAKKIILTQIGKSVPPHSELKKIVTDICPKAVPAYDNWLTG